jgi:hypothetical protein
MADRAWVELRNVLESEVAAMEWRLEKLSPTERISLLDELTDRLVAKVTLT